MIQSKLIWQVPMTLLALAVLPLPYSYYIAVRTVVFLAAIALLISESEPDGERKYKVGFVLITLVYNPIVPVHLFKELWITINIGTAVFFYFHMSVTSRRTAKALAAPNVAKLRKDAN